MWKAVFGISIYCFWRHNFGSLQLPSLVAADGKKPETSQVEPEMPWFKLRISDIVTLSYEFSNFGRRKFVMVEKFVLQLSDG